MTLSITTALVGVLITLLGALIALTWRSATLATRLLEAVKRGEERDDKIEARLQRLDGGVLGRLRDARGAGVHGEDACGGAASGARVVGSGAVPAEVAGYVADAYGRALMRTLGWTVGVAGAALIAAVAVLVAS